MRAVSCLDKSGCLQDVEGCRDFLACLMNGLGVHVLMHKWEQPKNMTLCVLHKGKECAHCII